MLVLSRKQSERLIIGDNIVITIVRVAGRSVRVGIEAPPEIQIQREEVRSRAAEMRCKPLACVA